MNNYDNNELKECSEVKSELDYNHPYTTCPNCGRDISEANDAGNGFCVECTRKYEGI